MSKTQSLASADSGLLVPFAFRNRFINGDMRVDQRNSGSAATITAGAALIYPIDRWWAACTGANITAQQVAGNATIGLQKLWQFTGAASVTSFGFGQRIMAANSFDLAGQACNLSFVAASSSLTSFTWIAYYANTTDTFGTIASPAKTQFATGTVTLTSSLQRFNIKLAIPAAATTGVEILLSGGALLASQTMTFGGAQLELGNVFTGMETPPVEDSMRRCGAYYRYLSNVKCWSYNTSGNVFGLTVTYEQMRASPTLTFQSTAYANASSMSYETVNTTMANLRATASSTASCWFETGVKLDAESYT